MGIFNWLSRKKTTYSKQEELILSIIKDLKEYLATFNTYKINPEHDLQEEIKELRNYNAIVKTLLRVIKTLDEELYQNTPSFLFEGVDRIISEKELNEIYKQISKNSKQLKNFEQMFMNKINPENSEKVIQSPTKSQKQYKKAV
jgi:esterase/lipase